MSKNRKNNTLGPFNKEEELIYAEENLISDVQFILRRVMRKKDISKTKLAERLGVKPPTLSRMLEKSNNLSLKTLARLFYALEDTPSFTSSCYQSLIAAGEAKPLLKEEPKQPVTHKFSSVWLLDAEAHKSASLYAAEMVKHVVLTFRDSRHHHLDNYKAVVNPAKSKCLFGGAQWLKEPRRFATVITQDEDDQDQAQFNGICTSPDEEMMDRYFVPATRS